MILTKNIKEYCQEKKMALRKKLEEMEKSGKRLCLAVVQVGENEASLRYIRNKKKDCEEVGIVFEWYHYPEEITTEELIFEIEDLQAHVSGLIVQLPLPQHIDVERVKRAINPQKDVDGFHPDTDFNPCTPSGIVRYLEDGCGYSLSGKNVVIIGRSDIVGKPLAQMMTDRDATVTLCHSKTKNIWQFIEGADLVVSAVGKAKFLNCYSIRVPVIDVGINFDESGKLVGDCFNTVGRDVSPVPGGVGLLTRSALLENVVLAATIGETGNGNGYKL